MIIRGLLGRRRMQILIDTRSTHNFLNDKLAPELQISVELMGKHYTVILIVLSFVGKCKVRSSLLKYFYCH